METLQGKVIKGKGKGRKMGFPTLNIRYKGEKSGVFTAKVFCGEKEYKGAANVGASPTLDPPEKKKEKFCEVFLLDVGRNFKYEGIIKIDLIKKIRETKKFQNEKELKEQIAKDVDFAKITLC